MKSLSVFDYIRKINSLPADILSPAKFKILVEIAMQIAEKGKSSLKNKEISMKTYIKPSSVKVLMSQLKKDNFIKIEKQDGLRMINLVMYAPEKRLMVINQNHEKVNGDLPFSPQKSPTPIIDNVVVVLLKKYRFDFGPVTLAKMSRFSTTDQIRAIEATRANAETNPERYIDKIFDNGCKGIRIDNKSKYDNQETERMDRLRTEALQAQRLGFKSAGYSH